MSTENVTVVRNEVEPCHMQLDIEVPGEVTQAVYDAALGTVAAQGRVPGFRPGKAPRKLLVRQYGAHIEQESLRQLINQGTQHALASQDVIPDTIPQVVDEESLRVDPGKPFVFSVTFDVVPEFELPDYTNITVSREATAVPEDRVDEVIDGWLARQATLELVDRAAEPGDIVKATYSSELPEGLEVPATGQFFLTNTEGTWLQLEDPELIPGTKEGLVGVSPGDEREMDVTFPEDYHVEVLQGQTVHYRFEIQEIRRSQKPELTDELAQSMGADSVEGIRENVRQNLEIQEERAQQDHIRDQILNALFSDLDFPVPPARKQAFMYQALQQLYSHELQQGTDPSEINSKLEELRTAAEDAAERRVKRFYVFQRIAEKENIDVDQQTLNDNIEYMAKRENVTPKVMLRRLRENGALDNMITSLREERVMSRLVELANIVESEPSKE